MIFVNIVSIIAAAAALANGYYSQGHNTGALWILVLGAAWLLAEVRRQRWFAPLGFLLYLVVAGYGMWIDLPTLWMLAGAVSALIAWDLSDFLLRVQVAAPEDEVPGLARRHLVRLAILAAIGLGLSLFSMLYQMEFSFEWAVFLAILAALGVTYFVGRVRRGES
jgi:hypothetical protein